MDNKIISKICSNCGIEKSLEHFHLKKKSKDGYNTICKSCRSDYQKMYRQKNADYLKEYLKNYQSKNKVELAKKAKEYRLTNKDKITNYRKERYLTNRDSILLDRKAYYENNKQKILNRTKNYQKKNKVKVRQRINRWFHKKTKEDSLFKLTHNIRSLIKNSLKHRGIKKNTSLVQILGCSSEEFKVHLESQFQDGMSWDNHGMWHLDHIIPISWGKTEEEIIALNHHTNFQPLWAKDNYFKSNRFAGKMK